MGTGDDEAVSMYVTVAAKNRNFAGAAPAVS